MQGLEKANSPRLLLCTVCEWLRTNINLSAGWHRVCATASLPSLRDRDSGLWNPSGHGELTTSHDNQTAAGRWKKAPAEIPLKPPLPKLAAVCQDPLPPENMTLGQVLTHTLHF